jgi:3-phenylpropionate/trans-cinnamate dioxygenase ferredoxin subunit
VNWIKAVSDSARQGEREWPVAQASEIPPGGRKIVEVKGRSIGVFNVHGSFVAVLNACPHELAPVCLGAVRGTALASMPSEYHWGREGEILACPWHGWEFDLLTGQALADKRKRLRLYPVVVREGTVYILA